MASQENIAWLLKEFNSSKKYPEYTLLSSYLARCISGKYGSTGDLEEAIRWSEKSLALLDDKHHLRQAYGGDADYMASVQACIVLKVRWMSLSEESMHWYKAKALAEDMLCTGFPSIYSNDNNSKDGISLALMLMGLYNRLGDHTRAMELGTRLQQQAQIHSDVATECRASFNWAVATLLLSKQHKIEQKTIDATAAMDSACHVLSVLKGNPSAVSLLGLFVQAVAEYSQWLSNPSINDIALRALVSSWSLDTQWGILDLVQMHSTKEDESLASLLVSNLDAASDF